MTTYAEAVEKISSRKHLLLEVEPKNELWNWALMGGKSNTYEITWSHFAATSIIKGGLYRRLIGVEEDGAALTERATIALVEANVNSWYFNEISYESRDFDGSADYYIRGADLTGNADGKEGIFSAWVRFDGGDSSTLRIITNSGTYFSIYKSTDNKIYLRGEDDGGTKRLEVKSTTQYYASDTAWHHILFSWDLNAGDTHLYIDDVDRKNEITADDAEVDYTRADWTIGAQVNAANKLNGTISKLYFALEYLDLSVEANRRKFIDANGLPEPLGNNGETPTGSQPIIYCPVGDGTDNKGYGGNFTAEGSPTKVTIGPKIYVHATGAVDPDTLDMMAAKFRCHFSTTGKLLDVLPAGQDATDLDGTGDYFDRGADLTNNADGSKGTFAAMVRIDGGDGTVRTLMGSDDSFFLLTIEADNKFHLEFKRITPGRRGTCLKLDSSTAFTAGTAWIRLLFSWDLTGDPKANFYINDVDEKVTTTLYAATIDYTRTDWTIGDEVATGAEWDGALLALWFSTVEFVDFSSPSNRRLFFDAAGNPVPLGEAGKLATGSQPIVYLPDGDATNNKGYGENFSSNGTPAAIDGPVTGLPIYFEKRILADSSASAREKAPDLISGTQRTGSGDIALDNHDGLFDILAHDWSWKNAICRYKLGLDDVGYGEYVTAQELIIDDIEPGEEQFGLSLIGKADSWRQRLPLNPYFAAGLGDGVSGTRKPVLLGGKGNLYPPLIDDEETTPNEWIYQIADPDLQNINSVPNVKAIKKSDGSINVLTVAVDYTISLTDCTIILTDNFDGGAEMNEVYDIVCDARGVTVAELSWDVAPTSTDYLKWPGEIAKYILLTYLDYAEEDLDLVSFLEADTYPGFELGVWIRDATTVREVLRQIERSCHGYIRQRRDGLIEFFVWDPWSGSEDAIELSDEDFAEFTPDSKGATDSKAIVYHETTVRYDRNFFTDDWSLETVSHTPTEDLIGATQTITLDTMLKSSADATTLAGRLNFLSRGIRFEFKFRERGVRLVDANLNKRVRVNKTRAPSSTGSFVNRLMDLIEIEAEYLAPSVSGRLADLQLGIGKWTDDSAPAWGSATDAEKADSGFWCDANGRADSSDPATKDVSVWW